MPLSAQKILVCLHAALLVTLVVPFADGAVLTADTIWRGNVTISEDVIVPAGVTLTVAAGTHVTVVAAEKTKTDPEYLSPLTEITVRGTFRVEGSDTSPVVLSALAAKSGSWAGVVIDGGKAFISVCRISDAETAVHLLGGDLQLDKAILTGNRYGIVAQGREATARLTGSRITANDYGLFMFDGMNVIRQQTTVEGNLKKNLYDAPKTTPRAIKVYTAGNPVFAREYGDEVLVGETVWQGRIRVNGFVRVPEKSRLVILPGTIVEFLKKDTNGDGMGENGLLIQGRLLAKGTREAPIFFRSAEKSPQRGDWDSINIMNSDGAQNLIEYCQIEDAYRGAHFHFSNLSITNSIFRNNYRGLQFQESAVEIRNSLLYGNKSGLQARDSTIALSDTRISDNYEGANFFRVHLTASGNRFLRNSREGLRLRESTAQLTENLLSENRFGLLISDTFQAVFRRNVVSENSEVGLSLKNVDNLEVNGNFFTGNGFNGLNIQDARAVVRKNLFAGNGERGMGIHSFTGTLSGNNFASNPLNALDYEGKEDMAAPDNWWGGVAPEKVIGDKRIDPKRGNLWFTPASPVAHQIAWPLGEVTAKADWYGVVKVDAPLTIAKEGRLAIAPGTRVLFGKNAGLTVRGALIAEGKRDSRIEFSAQEPNGHSSWDEIMFEYSEGSRIDYCKFEFSTWGLHSHFTPLTVSNSIFSKNYGGIRFRSGPMQIIRSVFTDNVIGIRSYRGNAVILENVITNNDTGIFVREKGSGLNITSNNLSANRGYAIRIGDFNDEDVPARRNWWGAGEPSQYLFDGRSEPGIGNVLYEPHLLEPVTLEGGGP